MKTWHQNLKKIGIFFSNFNPFPSLPFEAAGDRKQFQHLQIVFNNKPRPLVLEFNRMRRHILDFYKVAK